MIVPHILLAVSWIIYCLLHSILASTKVKKQLQNRMGNNFRYYRLGYTIFSFIGLAGILIYQFSIPAFHLFARGLLLNWIGVGLMLVGSSIMLLMIWKYFRRLSGIMWLTKEGERSRLEIKGLHKYVRHPLYLGTFIFIWGWFLVDRSLSFLISSSIITIYTLIALKFEEEKLIREFGNDYIQYKKKVPSLIPKF